MQDDLKEKNRRVLRWTLGFVAFMVFVAFASVPIYRLTCQVMGWGGTTQVVDANPHKPQMRDITVQFSSNIARDMPLSFRPDIRSVRLKVGADGFVAFIAENISDQPIVGTAVYNVTPLKAGKYFYKTQCFCFDAQVFVPGEKVNMPVVFFIDPAIMDDPEMRNVNTITLSYTFFRHDSQDLEKAMEKFYSENKNKT